MKIIIVLVTAFLVAGTPAEAARTTLQAFVSGVGPATSAGRVPVEVALLNGGTADVPAPPEIRAILTFGAVQQPVMLGRTPGQGHGVVARNGFLRATYVFDLPAGSALGTDASLSLVDEPGARYAFNLDAGTVTPASDPGAAVLSTQLVPAAPVTGTRPDRGDAFVGNLSTYAPVYAVFGPGTDTDARLQISFKYQLFGNRGVGGGEGPWENGIHFAYTQRMFWNLGPESSPFRSVDFMPELFYLLPAAPVGERLALGAQAGFRHESNGRDGLASRSLNTLYVQPVATTAIGGVTVSAGPRLWLYAGSLEDNPDIRRYRGNTGLFVEIGRPDGFRLSTNSRMNLGNGKGAIDAELSYPLASVVDTNLSLYVFGQAFAGYGENLLDYDRRVTRARIGIGIVR